MRQGNLRLSTKPTATMDVEIRPLGNRGVEILPTGRLDENTIGELRPMLLDSHHPQRRVLLNLSGLDHIDAAGMALVMIARLELEAGGTRFVVESSNAAITRELIAGGLPRFVTISPRRIDALRSLGEEAEPEAVRRAINAGS